LVNFSSKKVNKKNGGVGCPLRGGEATLLMRWNKERKTWGVLGNRERPQKDRGVEREKKNAMVALRGVLGKRKKGGKIISH